MISRRHLDHASRILQNGGVIAYPTESVFGLGCDPGNHGALQRILKIKHRPAHKGLIILVSRIEQAFPFIEPLSTEQLDKINQERSRATTWLIPRKPHLSGLLCGNHQKLAVRITNHPIAHAICEETNNALVSTSCNLSGKPEMKTTTEVRNQLGSQIDMIVEGECGNQPPSQIIDLLSDRVVRE